MHTHAQNQEHTYHVLENNNGPLEGVKNAAFFSCHDGRSDTQSSQADSYTMPIYQAIDDERPIEEQLYAQVPLSPLLTASSQSQETAGPIYQDITQLSVFTNAETISTSARGKTSTVV